MLSRYHTVSLSRVQRSAFSRRRLAQVHNGSSNRFTHLRGERDVASRNVLLVVHVRTVLAVTTAVRQRRQPLMRRPICCLCSGESASVTTIIWSLFNDPSQPSITLAPPYLSSPISNPPIYPSLLNRDPHRFPGSSEKYISSIGIRRIDSECLACADMTDRTDFYV
jgi:hypothetical protein